MHLQPLDCGVGCFSSCVFSGKARAQASSSEACVLFSLVHGTNTWTLIRRRHVQHALDQLDSNSGTGPDGVATKVLKRCASVLSIAIAKLVRKIVNDGFWPTAWTEHWLLPLYKKQSVYDPCNYRAINLTAQLSKVAERILSPHFLPILEQRAFGADQFAYRKGHRSRDAVMFYALSWILSLECGYKVGVYASDVSAAFDRVSSTRLMKKLRSFGLSSKILAVIESWLRDRQGYVVVAGKKSRRLTLCNMVFQGTVWGPSLWNAFFGDCVLALHL